MKITLLATSDTHGFIEPTNYVDSGLDKPFGIEKACSTIKNYQKTHPDEKIIVLDNGDFLEGSPMAYYVAKRADKQDQEAFFTAYNQVGYQLGTIGNHEFDYGTDYLERALNASDRPVVNANILDNAGRPLFGQQYRIIERAGIKIAILGLTTRAVLQWKNHDNVHEEVHFHTAVSVAKELVPQLKKIADVVIVCYHGGFERNLKTGKVIESLSNGENEAYQLLSEVKGIDALITGHQHRKIATKVFNVPVTQPGYRGEAVGKIIINLEPSRDGGYIVTDRGAHLIETKNAEFDRNVAIYSHQLDKKVDHWLAEPLAR